MSVSSYSVQPARESHLSSPPPPISPKTPALSDTLSTRVNRSPAPQKQTKKRSLTPVSRVLDTSTCTPYPFEDATTRFTLLDTPGFDDPNRDNLEILASITAFLSSPSAPHIAGILLTHNITVNRLTGSARLNQAIVRALCGERFVPRLVLLTTMWNQIPGPAVHDECERREAQLLASSSSGHGETGGYGGVMRFNGSREAARWVLAELMRILPAADTAPPAQIVAELSAGTPLSQTRAGRVILDERERREKQREAEYQEELEEERERLRAKQAERARLARQAGSGGHHRRSSSRTRRDGGFAGAPWVPAGPVDLQYQAEIRMAYGNSWHDDQPGYGGLQPVLPVDTRSRPTQDLWVPPLAHPGTALVPQVDSGAGRQITFSFFGLRDRVGDFSHRWRWSGDTAGSGNKPDPSRR